MPDLRDISEADYNRQAMEIAKQENWDRNKLVREAHESRGKNFTEYGTCRRGRGQKVHVGHKSFYIQDGRQTYVSIGADCNSNGQFAGRDFQKGFEREVTCIRCQQINRGRRVNTLWRTEYEVQD